MVKCASCEKYGSLFFCSGCGDAFIAEQPECPDCRTTGSPIIAFDEHPQEFMASLAEAKAFKAAVED